MVRTPRNLAAERDSDPVRSRPAPDGTAEPGARTGYRNGVGNCLGHDIATPLLGHHGAQDHRVLALLAGRAHRPSEDRPMLGATDLLAALLTRPRRQRAHRPTPSSGPAARARGLDSAGSEIVPGRRPGDRPMNTWICPAGLGRGCPISGLWSTPANLKRSSGDPGHGRPAPWRTPICQQLADQPCPSCSDPPSPSWASSPHPARMPSTPPRAVVISEVYGGGGNTGAPYNNDFIELYNNGTAPVTSPAGRCSTPRRPAPRGRRPP